LWKAACTITVRVNDTLYIAGNEDGAAAAARRYPVVSVMSYFGYKILFKLSRSLA